jgi:hypothetical protein
MTAPDVRRLCVGPGRPLALLVLVGLLSLAGCDGGDGGTSDATAIEAASPTDGVLFETRDAADTLTDHAPWSDLAGDDPDVLDDPAGVDDAAEPRDAPIAPDHDASSDPCEGVVCVPSLPAVLHSVTSGTGRYRVTVPDDGFFLAFASGGGTELTLHGGTGDGTVLDAHPSAVGGRLAAGTYEVRVAAADDEVRPYTLQLALTTSASLQALGLAADLAADALTVFGNAWAWGATRRPEYVVVDFTLHSALPRQWVLDLSTGQRLWHLRVAHGRKSTDGIDLAHAVTFGNEPGSNQSSLGLMRSAGPYVGTYGPSFRLEGLEPGVNDQVCARDIVMHPWAALEDEYVERCGWARPSLGCPAIDDTLSPPVRERLKRPDGTPLDQGVAYLFWYPDADWHEHSVYLHGAGPTPAMTDLLEVECDSSTDGTPTPPLSTDYACD